MRALFAVAVAVAIAAVGACSPAAPEPRAPRAADRSTSASSSCPLGVHGARVLYEDTATGVRLTFTAPPDRVDALRSRVRHAAALHGTGGRRGEGHGGHHGTAGDHGLRAFHLPPVYTSAKDVEGGAAIDLTPYDAPQLDELRLKLAKRAEELMTWCQEGA